MKRIEFKVQGSQPEPYTVAFINIEGVVTAYCNCEAGQNGMHCKHRYRILAGNLENIVSKNLEDIKEVLSWLPGTRIESAVNTFKIAEKNFEKAKKEFPDAKRGLTSAFYGGK